MKKTHQKIHQALVILVVLTLTSAASVKSLKAQTWQKVVVRVEASDKFLRTIGENQKIVFEKEMVTGPETKLNQEFPLQFVQNVAMVEFSPTSDYGYLRIDLGLSNWPYTLMVVPGDTVKLQVTGRNEHLATSRNQAQLDVQLKLTHEIILDDRQIQRGDNPSVLAYLAARRDSMLRKIEQITLNYQDRIPPAQLRIIAANAISQLGMSYVNSLAGMALYADGVTKETREQAKMYIRRLYEEEILVTDTLVIRHSIWYAYYLFKLEQLWNGVQSNPLQLKRERFHRSYASIIERYDGVLREKLLTVLFRNSLSASNRFQELLQDGIGIVNDTLYYNILSKMTGAQSRNQAYSFHLAGEDGKFYGTSDFKGKTVVCKFWFRGCSGCIGLHNEMKAVLKKFQHNPDVVFVSINVDPLEKTWHQGLTDSIYSSSDYINLHIGTKGRSHPMIAYYNYSAFPQILIIDKDGRIITAAAERPDNETRRANLESLILEASK